MSAPVYKVEVEKKACPHCKSGAQWCIVDPDDRDSMIGSHTYEDRDEAVSLAKLLEAAHERGKRTARRDLGGLVGRLVDAVKHERYGGTMGEAADGEMALLDAEAFLREVQS